MNRESILAIVVGIGAVLGIVAFLVLAPSGGDFGRREVAGPPTMQLSVVEAHAQQFDDELPLREAGSQQEQAAATYLLGILQRNGYVVRLESVPVGDLVSSTNLIAQPAQIEAVSALVVVPYGSGEKPNGQEIGLFLELARALSVASPDHTVGFVALGAEFSDAQGGNLGSRRLARFLLDQDLDPLVVQIAGVSSGRQLSLTGDELPNQGPRLEVSPDVFAEAGFRSVVVAGDPDQLGPELLRALERL